MRTWRCRISWFQKKAVTDFLRRKNLVILLRSVWRYLTLSEKLITFFPFFSFLFFLLKGQDRWIHHSGHGPEAKGHRTHHRSQLGPRLRPGHPLRPRRSAPSLSLSISLHLCLSSRLSLPPLHLSPTSPPLSLPLLKRCLNCFLSSSLSHPLSLTFDISLLFTGTATEVIGDTSLGLPPLNMTLSWRVSPLPSEPWHPTMEQTI